jgi:hypothetical protein
LQLHGSFQHERAHVSTHGARHGGAHGGAYGGAHGISNVIPDAVSDAVANATPDAKLYAIIDARNIKFEEQIQCLVQQVYQHRGTNTRFDATGTKIEE